MEPRFIRKCRFRRLTRHRPRSTTNNFPTSPEGINCRSSAGALITDLEAETRSKLSAREYKNIHTSMLTPDNSPFTESNVRRGQQRIGWTPEADLTVDVFRPGYAPLPACWGDLSITGVMLVVPWESGSSLEVGGKLDLGFTVDDVCFHLSGKIVWVVPDDTGRIVKAGVHFDAVDDELCQMHPRLWEFFNRREAKRAKNPVDQPVEVLVSSEEFSKNAQLVDVSTSGIAMLLEGEAGNALDWVRHLGHKHFVEMTLSPGLPTVTVTARGERLEQRGSDLMMAFSFPEEDVADYVEELRLIEKWVSMRLRIEEDEELDAA
ncbi:MAG: hypothetical protein ACI8X5_003118 [Planctomycetota bacterium]